MKKNHSICLNEIGPLMGPTKALTFDKDEMCCSLLYQFNSVFTKPHPEEIVTINNPSSFLVDLGVYMSSNCTFDFYVTDLYKRCSNLSGWILRTFSTRETRRMMTLFSICGAVPA